MLVHYIEFSLPGFFFSEHEIHKVAERNPELIKVPEDAFAYRFFDRNETVLNGENLYGERQNYSPYTYFGTAYTLEEVQTLFPNEKSLISNMKYNNIKQVVKTRTGNWQPLKEEDIVINS